MDSASGFSYFHWPNKEYPYYFYGTSGSSGSYGSSGYSSRNDSSCSDWNEHYRNTPILQQEYDNQPQICGRINLYGWIHDQRTSVIWDPTIIHKDGWKIFDVMTAAVKNLQSIKNQPNVETDEDAEVEMYTKQNNDEKMDNPRIDPFSVRRPYGTPNPKYCCKICYVSSKHFIYHCPKGALVKQFAKTPYQGKKECCGEYRCPKCKRVWHSVKSMADMSQSCKKCDVSAYPGKQFDLKDLKFKANEKIQGIDDVYRPEIFVSEKEFKILMHVYKTCIFQSPKGANGPIKSKRM